MDLRAAGCALAAVCLIIASASHLTAQSAHEEVASHARAAQEDLREQRPDKAIEEFKEILAIQPDDIAVRANLGTLLYFTGDFKDSAAELQTVVKAQPDLWKAVTLLGMCEKRLGEVGPAQSHLESSFAHLADEKVKTQAGLELIELYYSSRDLEKADPVLTELRKLRPNDPAVLYTAHRIYAEQADEAALRVAIVAPRSPWMQQIIGEEMMTQGDTDAAIRHFREAEHLDQHLPGIHFELGEVLSSSSSDGDKQAAEEEYRTALSQNPEDEKTVCRLARIALRKSDVKTALAYYSHAVALQPQDPDANFGLGKVLLSMGELAKAQPVLEKAEQLDPSDAATRYQLGAMYRRLGRMDDAQREFAEFQRLKKAKEDLKDLYRAMRTQSPQADDETSTP